MKSNTMNKLFNKAGLAVMLCCLFFIAITFSCCTPLDTIPEQKIDVSTETEEENTADEGQEDIGEDTVTGTAEELSQEEEEEAEEKEPEDIIINVYYSNDTAEYLVPESRIIPPDNKYIDSLYELMKKPIDDSLFPLVPDTARINSVSIEESNALADFSQEFIDDRFVSDTVDILLLYAVVNTLTQFSEVNSVSLFIEGKKLDLLGQLDIKEPVFRRNDLIKEQ
jgi:spore germination protein GerM